MTFTRTGNVDVNADFKGVVDPAGLPPRVVSPAEALRGRYSIGTCAMIRDSTKHSRAPAISARRLSISLAQLKNSRVGLPHWGSTPRAGPSAR